MKLTEAHETALAEIMAWRRDMRHFRTDPVPETLMDALRAAMDAAPSVGNARPWRVLRVKDPALRARVRASFTQCNQAAAEAYEDVARQDYLRLKLAGLDQAPEHLAVFTDTDPDAGRGLGRATMPQTLEQSTAMAIYAVWLAARARNIGLGMVSIVDPAEMQQIFETPATWRFTAYLCVGFPAFEDDTPLLHRAGWQENAPTAWDIR